MVLSLQLAAVVAFALSEQATAVMKGKTVLQPCSGNSSRTWKGRGDNVTFASIDGLSLMGVDASSAQEEGLGPLHAAAACSALESWDPVNVLHARGVPTGKEKFVISPHHKTGFIFSKQSLRCINNAEPGTGAFLMAYKLPKSSSVLGNSKVIHVTRDPLKLLVSTYLYSRDIADNKEHEPQIMAPGSALWAQKLIMRHGMSADFMKTRPKDSLREHLKRVSVLSGMRVVLLTTLPEWETVEAATEWCEASASCMEMSLDHITQSTRAYKTDWKSIFEFTSVTPTAEMTSCLAMQDVNNPLFHKSDFSHHCSQGKVPESVRKGMEQQCIALDQELLDGRFTNASIAYRKRHRLLEHYGLPVRRSV